MNAIVLDRDQDIDSTAQVEKGTAGFATGEPVKRGAHTPEESAFDILNKMAGGRLHPDSPVISSATLPDFDEGARAEPQFGDESYIFTLEDLRLEVAGAWGQDNVDDDAFEKIKSFKIVEPATAISALRLADPASNDEMEAGVTQDGRHVVSGQDNITAAQAYSRALLAMTSDTIRNEGVNVFGTQKDQALLLLAAEDVGLKIINAPTDIPEAVLAAAKTEWETLKAGRLTTAAPAEETPAAEEAPAAAVSAIVEPTLRELADGVEVQEIPADQAAALLAEAGIEPAAAETEAVVEATTQAAAPEVAAAADADTPVAAVVEAVVEPVAVDTAPDKAAVVDDGIPVLTDVVEEGVKPELLPILAEGDVSAATYLKARAFYLENQATLPDSEGIVHPRSLVSEFQSAGVGSKKAATILKAMAAEGLLNKSDDVILPVYTAPGFRPAGTSPVI
ncbi:MAG: hypothetical protein HYS17_05555 [Micavibrio aeruginosavorus]|uniref:Uncharacterized protein n=1 Tax=Micavibrio aeruginosavorus TaxID=349221 RepID=A0A7T5R487_9BACT|nr:MAG: hypothetical protein HYS17_05555 [Micavibrio aeruginosavorus]